MHPFYVENLAIQRREQLLADAARSHRTRTMRAARRIGWPRTSWWRARSWFGSKFLTLAVTKWKAAMRRGVLSMLDVVKNWVPG